jgi:hypothetical protein
MVSAPSCELKTCTTATCSAWGFWPFSHKATRGSCVRAASSTAALARPRHSIALSPISKVISVAPIYEIFGLQRFFTDNTLTCVVGPCVVGSTAMTGTTDNKTTFGAGVGGSVLLPLIPKYLEFTV